MDKQGNTRSSLMKKYETLHVLIKSLSRSEKRYFKLFCGKEEREGNYLKLFDAIDAQGAYDEEAIKKVFRNERFVKQLHVTKIYLYRLILKTLRNFHEKISKDAVVKDGLRNLEILFNKELYQHCQYEINSIEQLCQKYDLMAPMVEVQNWQRKLRQALSPFDYPGFKEALVCQREALDILDNNHQHWKLAISVSEGRPDDSRLNPSDHPLLRSPNRALSLEARVLYHNTSYLINIKNNQSREGRKQLIELVDYLESMPDRIHQEPGYYVSSINNLLSLLVYSHEYTEALKFIAKAKLIYEGWKVTSENRNLLKQIFRTYNIELEIYRTQQDLADSLQMVANVEKTIHEYRNKMPKEYLLSFWFQFASIYFMKKDYNQSLHWVNQVLNSRFKNIRQDLVAQIHFLNLMVHFEQQNLFVMRYFVGSARRVLQKNRQLLPYEKVLLKFFTKISRLPVIEYKAAFKQLHVQLFPAHQEALVPASAPGYIHFRAWIEGSI